MHAISLLNTDREENIEKREGKMRRRTSMSMSAGTNRRERSCSAAAWPFPAASPRTEPLRLRPPPQPNSRRTGSRKNSGDRATPYSCGNTASRYLRNAETTNHQTIKEQCRFDSIRSIESGKRAQSQQQHYDGLDPERNVNTRQFAPDDNVAPANAAHVGAVHEHDVDAAVEGEWRIHQVRHRRLLRQRVHCRPAVIAVSSRSSLAMTRGNRTDRIEDIAGDDADDDKQIGQNW
jgi:hypothetical protein